MKIEVNDLRITALEHAVGINKSGGGAAKIIKDAETIFVWLDGQSTPRTKVAAKKPTKRTRSVTHTEPQ